MFLTIAEAKGRGCDPVKLFVVQPPTPSQSQGENVCVFVGGGGGGGYSDIFERRRVGLLL